MANDGYYSDEEKKTLLTLARGTIEAKLRRKELPDIAGFPAKMHETGSCFVTLHTKASNALRGCIGNIEAFEPLVDNVQHNAVNAAFDDPRFPPVGAVDELEGLRVEISILTPPEKIPSYDKFIVGEHGIILRNGFKGAVFLPQVAPEQGWDRETTLTHLCWKAGLPEDAWKRKDTTFQVFRAIVFSE